MIGLIVSVIVCYVIKGNTALLKETTNINEKLMGRAIEFHLLQINLKNGGENSIAKREVLRKIICKL